MINFRVFKRRAIAGFPPVARTNVEETALIYVTKLLATAVNDAKKLGYLREKSYTKNCLGELYEITGQISEAKQLISPALSNIKSGSIGINITDSQDTAVPFPYN
ncbi:hypothetical protein [Microcoleus asticus]|uniref:hypothetical protein n=1 Tax=Microcoleus asticus TaxID=2815231 RepID=UPI00155367CD|nr:hypothetical protein [Microcoleus asticus]